MYISNLKIENFRCFGTQKRTLDLPLLPGLNTLVGENDSGKTAIIDALRMLLGTRDHDVIRPQPSDFYYIDSTTQATSLRIEVEFSGLSKHEQANFLDYLTYQPHDKKNPVVLNLTLASTLTNDKVRSTIFAGLNTGGSGLKEVDIDTRDKMRLTYLRPLRDAEKEMDVGRNSRISKILRKQSQIDIGESEIDLSAVANNKFGDVIEKLGIVGIARLINQLLEQQPAVNSATNDLNSNFLTQLQMEGDNLNAKLGIGSDADDETLKRQMLEKIGITLEGDGGKRGLGSNNLLYIACEMLLLANSMFEPALLVIEEPEAHLHPQRQLKLIQFLQEKINKHKNEHDVHLQVIISTHSPTIASKLPIKCMAIIHRGMALPLQSANLKNDNIIFLERFLDATKSNLFFCRGLMIVEGDAENLLLPSFSKLLGVDFTETGVSVVNVGHTGLSRYANLYSGNETYPNPGINVACLHDLDLIDYRVARELSLTLVPAKKIKEIESRWNEARNSLVNNVPADFSRLNELLPENIISGLAGNNEDNEKITRIKKNKLYQGRHVKGFYSTPWTLEYALAFHGLGEELTIAACLAKAEHSTKYDSSKYKSIEAVARNYYKHLEKSFNSREVLAGKVYQLFLEPVSVYSALPNEPIAKLILTRKASKAATGQILGKLLEDEDLKLCEINQTKQDRVAYWSNKLPQSIVKAILHVTPASSSSILA